ncbi:hypothetical protein BGX26_008619 [Mortierella sp. AD094]|nr:hypothetical protein BGX26_008619 [Mortierella sp. AD094]
MNNGDVVPFLFDENLEEYIPQRIRYIPRTILEVITGETDNAADTISVVLSETATRLRVGNSIDCLQNNGEANINAAIPLAREKSDATGHSQLLMDNPTEDDVISLQVGAFAIINSSPIDNPNDKITRLRSSFNAHQQLCQSFSQAYMLGQMNQAMVIADQAKGIKDE